ncbi:MAG: ubiquinol-cytochrome c reductase iron-sulfur subunit [Actinobacteria bacterium]|nr:ubiquinol-cytochrome c reductase iron-sulfur subunit [Actinomycetota bacterium]
MNPLVIVIPLVVVLGAVVVFAALRRSDSGGATGALSRETRRRDRSETASLPEAEVLSGRQVEKSAAIERRSGSVEKVTSSVATYVPPDADAIGVTRRQFFNRSIIILIGLTLSGFGAAFVAFLWPTPKGGFGSKIRVGNVSDVLAKIAAGKGFLYLAEGRMWLTAYPASAIEKAQAVYPPAVLPGMEAGVVALYQKCPHLGCRVPSCQTSQWFECPCHGSQYNQAGEKKGGPAPRGMDRFAMEVAGGVLTVDTGQIFQGPPIGTNTTGQEAEGPHCVGGGH